MSSDWAQAKRKTDRSLLWVADYLRCRFGGATVVEADRFEDAKHATDLFVLDVDAKRVAVRLRDYYKYFAKYTNSEEFTIRSVVPSGAETELTKILAGWGDYIFYGFADYEAGTVQAFIYGDLDVFRHWYIDVTRLDGKEPGTEFRNKDGSRFRAFRFAELPRNFLLEHKSPYTTPLEMKHWMMSVNWDGTIERPPGSKAQGAGAMVWDESWGYNPFSDPDSPLYTP